MVDHLIFLSRGNFCRKQKEPSRAPFSGSSHQNHRPRSGWRYRPGHPSSGSNSINGGTVPSCDSCGWFFSWKIPLKWMNHYKYILDMVMKMVSKIFQNGLKWMIWGYHHFRKPPYVGDFLDDPRQLPLNPCWYPGSQHARVFHSQPSIYGYYMVIIWLSYG